MDHGRASHALSNHRFAPATNRLAAFFRCASRVGVSLETVIPDGRIHRVPAKDDRRGQRSGWYVFEGGRRGVVGNWKTGERQVWRASDLTAADREGLARMAHARMREDERRRAEAAQRAAFLWALGSPDPIHAPYLQAKTIPPCGARVLPRERNPVALDGYLLMLPVHNLQGDISSLQFIDWKGEKRFLPDGGLRGRGYVLGALPDQRSTGDVILCEGFATGASLHLDTGSPVACAFSAGNLLHLGRALRRHLPRAEITVAADNDARTADEIGRNPGIQSGMEAARAIGGRCVWPRIPGDFNDEWCRDLAG